LFLSILLIPLSTFIIFELRHNFFQIKSLIRFLNTKQVAGEPLFKDWVLSRIYGLFLDGLSLLPLKNIYTLPATLLLVWLFLKTKDKKARFRKIYRLYFYFYLGFWFLMFFYKGIVWGFFYWPFLPLTLIILSSLNSLINKKIFLIFYLYLLLTNFFIRFNFIKNSNCGWKIYRKIAFDIYTDALKEKEFGYYVFSPDLYSYSGRYAITYMQNNFPKVRSFPYSKKRLTYLIIEPAPSDKPWLNGIWWKENEVKIKSKPVKIFNYSCGIKAEKYYLTPEEIEIKSNPNLIQSTHFR